MIRAITAQGPERGSRRFRRNRWLRLTDDHKRSRMRSLEPGFGMDFDDPGLVGGNL